MLKEAFNERQLRGNGGGWLLVASENLWAAHAELTFRAVSTVTSSVQTQIIAAVPGRFKESQYFLGFVS